MEFARLLHGFSTCTHEQQRIFKRQRTARHQRGELAQAVTGNHLRLLDRIDHERRHRVQEHGRLGDTRGTQILIRAVEHNVRYTETQQFVGALKEFTNYGVVVVQVLAHTCMLTTLTGKNKRFNHNYFC